MASSRSLSLSLSRPNKKSSALSLNGILRRREAELGGNERDRSRFMAQPLRHRPTDLRFVLTNNSFFPSPLHIPTKVARNQNCPRFLLTDGHGYPSIRVRMPVAFSRSAGSAECVPRLHGCWAPKSLKRLFQNRPKLVSGEHRPNSAAAENGRFICYPREARARTDFLLLAQPLHCPM